MALAECRVSEVPGKGMKTGAECRTDLSRAFGMAVIRERAAAIRIGILCGRSSILGKSGAGKKAPNPELNQKWQDINEQIETDLETFSKEASEKNGDLLGQLAVRKSEKTGLPGVFAKIFGNQRRHRSRYGHV